MKVAGNVTEYKPGDLVQSIHNMSRPVVKGDHDYSLNIPKDSYGMVIQKLNDADYSFLNGLKFYDCLFTSTTGVSIVTDVNERNLKRCALGKENDDNKDT